MEEFKQNKCDITFLCNHRFGDPCQHYENSGGIAKCMHCDTTMNLCISTIAKVNKMFVETELMGVKLKAEGIK